MSSLHGWPDLGACLRLLGVQPRSTYERLFIVTDLTLLVEHGNHPGIQTINQLRGEIKDRIRAKQSGEMLENIYVLIERRICESSYFAICKIYVG